MLNQQTSLGGCRILVNLHHKSNRSLNIGCFNPLRKHPKYYRIIPYLYIYNIHIHISRESKIHLQNLSPMDPSTPWEATSHPTVISPQPCFLHSGTSMAGSTANIICSWLVVSSIYSHPHYSIMGFWQEDIFSGWWYVWVYMSIIYIYIYLCIYIYMGLFGGFLQQEYPNSWMVSNFQWQLPWRVGNPPESVVPW